MAWISGCRGSAERLLTGARRGGELAFKSATVPTLAANWSPRHLRHCGYRSSLMSTVFEPAADAILRTWTTATGVAPGRRRTGGVGQDAPRRCTAFPSLPPVFVLDPPAGGPRSER